MTTLLQRVRRGAYRAVIGSESDLLPNALATAYVSWRQRRPVRVKRREGVWLIEFADGAIVDTRIRESFRAPSDQEALARDIFIHDHDLGPGSVILDVGAGIGTETAAFARVAGPQGQVHCFEAHPTVYQCLQTSIALNQLENVSAYWLAVGAEEGVIQIESALDGHIGNSVMTDDGDIDVEMVSLDSFCDSHGIDEIDLLKMNIEGAEVDALRGMRRFLANTRCVSISCHDFKAERTGNRVFATLDEVCSILAEHGFSTRRRLEDPRPWVRDTVYGTR